MTTAEDRFSASGQASDTEIPKWIPILIGGALVAYGLSRRSKGGALVAAAGGAFAFQGTRVDKAVTPSFARSSMLIGLSRTEVYDFWRNFENLPRFMKHLESVSSTSDKQSKWTAIGPAGYRVQWTAETVSDRPGEHIAWRSLPNSEMEVDGTVEFREAPGKRGTIVDAMIQYRNPAGAVGNAVAKLFGKDPRFLMRQDMRRLKSLLEAGEIPTTEGQSHGPRSMVAAAAKLIDPDEPLTATPERSTELLEASRRVS